MGLGCVQIRARGGYSRPDLPGVRGQEQGLQRHEPLHGLSSWRGVPRGEGVQAIQGWRLWLRLRKGQHEGRDLRSWTDLMLRRCHPGVPGLHRRSVRGARPSVARRTHHRSGRMGQDRGGTGVLDCP